MVLTDREIEIAIQSGQIRIEPAPAADAYSSTSVDLTLASMIRVWKLSDIKGVEQVVCPVASTGYTYHSFAHKCTQQLLMGAEGHVIRPGEFLLAWTNETVDLLTHSRLAARVEGKSSLARLGIGVHVTAPTIHAGFTGPIQLEVCNHGPLNVKLLPGMRICQLIFEQTLGVPVKGYRGQFFQQEKGS